MSDEFRDHIAPIGGKAPIDNLDGHEPSASAQPPHAPRSLSGRIVSVRTGRGQSGTGEHMLDVTVGGGANAELVVRVLGAVPPNIEGKRAIIYIDD